jgi:uncharacterized membrane protein
METNMEHNITDGKNAAIIAYLTLIGLIVAFVMNNDKKNAFSTYHIRQSLGLMCTSLALVVINVIPFLGWVISIMGFIVLLVLWVIGLMNAINGKEKSIPLLGSHYNKWFANI